MALLLVPLQALGEQLLALCGAPAAVLLHPAEEGRKLVVALALGVLCVLLEAPDVLETEMRDGDQVVSSCPWFRSAGYWSPPS